MLEHPQTRFRGLAPDYVSDSNTGLRGVPYPVIFDAEPRVLGRMPPMLGQHTREVLLEFGWSSEAISQLQRSRVVLDGNQ
jgi:formyl-CoA transferase